MYGTAPSKELRRVFGNFKKWLLRIYKPLVILLPLIEYASPITPEVQAVFDRALASEEAIIERQKLDGYFAKLPDDIVDNLSEQSKVRLSKAIENAYDKAVESLTRESLKNFTKERRAEIDAYRDEITPTITGSVQAETLYVTERHLIETLDVKSATQAARRYQDLIDRAKEPRKGADR